jgi:RNA recognition motif-containing protein
VFFFLAKVIKGKDGRNRGFAFITMSTAEEAAAAVEKLNASVSVCSQPWMLKCDGLHHAVVWRVSLSSTLIDRTDVLFSELVIKMLTP